MSVMTVCKNQIQFQVDASTYEWFWNLMLRNEWEEETFRIFDRFIDSRHPYLDIGAWIGPTVLYGAHRAKHVYAIEPDIVAYQQLSGNVELNPSISAKVTSVHAALTARSGNARLYTRTHPGDSSSSLIPTLSDEHYCEVRGLTINEFTTDNGVTNVNFIKMDIEAGEYLVIPAMRDFLECQRPTLYLSLHPQFLCEEVNLMLAKHAHSERSAPFTTDRPLRLTKRLLDALNFYKYVYDTQGNRVDMKSILEVRTLGQFVFTDERW